MVFSQERVVAVLSSERFRPYVDACEGDPEAALHLYEWNLAMSGAMYELIGMCEIALRNTMESQLAVLHQDSSMEWFDDPGHLLQHRAHADIATARQRATRGGRSETRGRVVAELTFGFWRYLLASRYEATLWTPALRHGFPNLQPQSRQKVDRVVASMHALRNRLAQHEPIHGRNLARDVEDCLKLLGWIDTDVQAWASSVERARAVLASRPDQGLLG